jgi:hypothetical protein
VQSLREQPLITNEVIPLEDPVRLTVADDRFFYLKSSGSLVALEAMNGESHVSSTTITRQKLTQRCQSPDDKPTLSQFNPTPILTTCPPPKSISMLFSHLLLFSSWAFSKDIFLSKIQLKYPLSLSFVK